MTHFQLLLVRRTVFVALVGVLTGCASWPRAWGPPCAVDARPRVHRQPIGWHLFDVTVIEPLKQVLRVGRLGRRLLGVPVRALNLEDGAVTHSAFLAGREPATLSPQDVRWGPTPPGDAPAPPLTITKMKMEGKTAGFFATDARGVRYLVKLDPVEAPELLSGAEVVTSKLLYALGYHVPSYEVAELPPAAFVPAPDAQLREAGQAPRPLRADDLEALLDPRARHGTVRVVMSRILEGTILGPARFKRFRDCAEIRALKLAYAWTNNIDSKDHNTLLVWTGERTTGYLIDFGTSLGADAGRGSAQRPCAGWTYIVDLKEAALELATLGLHRPPCEPGVPAFDEHIGRLSSDVDPEHWKPYAPNVAFWELNETDAVWMARRMAALSRKQIEAAVSAARYSRPEDAAYLASVLEARRDAIVRHYLEDDG